MSDHSPEEMEDLAALLLLLGAMPAANILCTDIVR